MEIIIIIGSIIFCYMHYLSRKNYLNQTINIKTMKTLKISESKALELYKTGSTELKTILEESFGKDFFNQKITDKIKGLEDIYNHLGIDEEDVLIFKNPKNAFEKYINACAIIPKIIQVYNEGVELDFNNSNQYKYQPYFKKAGSGWSSYRCDSWSYSAFSACAHHYATRELAIDAGTKFIKVYSDYLNYKG